MLTIKIEGLDAARQTLQGFSDRRFAAAVATALTRTGAAVRDDWRREIGEAIDKPTPLVLNAPRLEAASASRLQAVVSLRDQVRDGGIPPSEILGTQERGGDRRLRKFERALQAQGSMPAGHRVVPGLYATIDAYGNVSRGQIVQVINQLGSQYSPGYARVISANAAKRAASARRTGRQYIAIPQRQGDLAAGIYQRQGRALLPVFFFVRHTRYQARTHLLQAAERLAGARLRVEFDRAVREHLARLQARGAAR